MDPLTTGLVMSLAECEQVGFSLPSAMTERWPKPAMPNLAKQRAWELRVRVLDMQRREPRRDRTWGRKLPVGPWSRSADRQTAS